MLFNSYEYLVFLPIVFLLYWFVFHKNYLDLLPKKQFEEYKMFLLELKNEFPSIKLLDYTELQLPDNYFLNSDHLNLKGARYFTEMVVKEINK